MEEKIFSRTELLIGKEGIERLDKSKVAIVGIGGVGSYAAEALARAGVGTLILVDPDIICPSNLNRQIHALHSTLGLPKVDVMKNRILDINPDAKVISIREFYSEKTSEKILSGNYDYVVDAIDSLASKVNLIIKCKKINIPIISAMGAGNKLDPTKFQVADISETSVCPMARKIRKELRKNGIQKGVKVVFSNEAPLKNQHPPSSISFVPSVMGLIIAGEVINYLIKN
ncbi:MAG: tRNA threonylcarbamoyladenosine dehydratase [Thermoanaerobacteraceae bacterium]|nr:tRNA threonylcarbamoyladenosine dehydratase [Thermoanaerobacteraceae bacterium]